MKIPAGHIWIEGDYSENSLDSNTFGPIPLGLLKAKATHVVYPKFRELITEYDQRKIRVNYVQPVT